jgi:hypothetical protein
MWMGSSSLNISKISEFKSTTINCAVLEFSEEAHLVPQSLEQSQLKKEEQVLRSSSPCLVLCLARHLDISLVLTTAVTVPCLRENKFILRERVPSGSSWVGLVSKLPHRSVLRSPYIFCYYGHSPVSSSQFLLSNTQTSSHPSRHNIRAQ